MHSIISNRPIQYKAEEFRGFKLVPVAQHPVDACLGGRGCTDRDHWELFASRVPLIPVSRRRVGYS